MTDTTPTPRTVAIVTDGTHGSIHVDGHDVSDRINAFSIDWNTGYGPLPVVTIQKAAASVDFHGLALIEVAVPIASGDAVRALDPEEVGERVAGACLDMSQGLYATVLDVIGAMVDEMALDAEKVQT